MQDLLDQLGDNAWILFFLAISVFSWVAGKLKEWTQRNAGANKPTPTQPQPVRVHDDEDEEEEAEDRAVDLAALLGLTPPREQRPQSQPRTAGPPRSASPSARPAPGPPPIARPVDRVPPPPPAARPKPPPPAVEPESEPAPTPQPVIEEPVVEPTTPSARRSRRARFGRLSRPELRRAIILAEVLDKPLAMRDESV